jgi:transposase InsO family protein
MSKKVEMRFTTAKRRGRDLVEAKQKAKRPRAFRRKEYKRRVRMVKEYQARCNYLKKGESAAQVAARYGCSSSLVRHYTRVVKEKGRSGLMPRSRAPHHPVRRLTFDIIGLIVAIRVLTGWGPQRLARNLDKQSQGQVKVSHTSVWKVLGQRGLIRINHPKGKRDGVNYHRWGRSRPNALWHLDCKVSEGWIFGQRVTILIVLDAHSRYALAAQARLGDANAKWVRQILDQCATRYGRPDDILTDNASIFIAQVVEDWFGQPFLHSAPYYPQTNGKAEAFIRTILRECLDLEVADRQRRAGDETVGFTDLPELQALLDQWLVYYNNYREHSSLNFEAPVKRYTGKSYQVLGFAAVPRLADLDIGFVKVLEVPDEINPTYLKRCFALAPVNQSFAIC